jgi:signal transduction histidine kinase
MLFFGYILIIGGSSVLGDGQYTFLISSILLISSIWFIYGRIEQSFFLFALSTIIIMMIQTLLLIPLYFIMGGIEYTFKNGLIAQTSAVIIVAILVRFVPLSILYNYIEKKNQIFKILCIEIMVVVFMILTYMNVDFEGLIENFAIVIILAMLLMIISIIFLRNGLKNLNAEEQVRIYEQYLPIVDELVDELRAKQHDFDNHLLAIKMMIEMNKNSPDTINKVEAYIDEIDEDFKNSNLIKLDNKVVAGFLYSKSKWAFSNNIEFNINIDYYDLRTSLKDYEVIEILSILLDNAIETDVQNNTIIINIKKENNRCVLEVLNKHPYLTAEQINVMFKKGYSTKNLQGRGLGLFKLRQSIDKNHGKLHVSNVESENNFILFKVVLPK